MARPKYPHATPGELDILKILWERGPSTVRQVWEVLNKRRRRHYTTVMSLLNIMTEKRLTKRRPLRRAFLYEAAVDRQKAFGQIIEDLVGRVFEGSVSALVTQLLGRARPSEEELDEIRKAIEEYQQTRGKR